MRPWSSVISIDGACTSYLSVSTTYADILSTLVTGHSVECNRSFHRNGKALIKSAITFTEIHTSFWLGSSRRGVAATGKQFGRCRQSSRYVERNEGCEIASHRVFCLRGTPNSVFSASQKQLAAPKKTFVIARNGRRRDPRITVSGH